MKHFETEARIGLVMLSGKIYDYDNLIKIFEYSWLTNNQPITYGIVLYCSINKVNQHFHRVKVT